MTVKITVIWDVTPSIMLEIYWHFEWTFVIQLYEPPPSGSEVWVNRSLWFVGKFLHDLFVMHIFQNQRISFKMSPFTLWNGGNIVIVSFACVWTSYLPIFLSIYLVENMKSETKILLYNLPWRHRRGVEV